MRSMLFKLLTGATLLLSSSKLLGSPVPDLTKWIQEYKAAPAIAGDARYPKSLLLLKEQNADPIVDLKAFDEEAVESISYLDLSHLQKSSVKRSGKSSWPSFLVAADYVQRTADIDTVILQPNKGLWRVRYQQNPVQPVQTFEITPPSGSRETPDNIDGVLRSLFASLGYDGIVLSQKGDYLLVGSVSSLLAKKKIQSMAIAGSHPKLILSETSYDGIAIITLIRAQAGFGLFRIALRDPRNEFIPIGTKVIIERPLPRRPAKK